jgi:hypothetical protein
LHNILCIWLINDYAEVVEDGAEDPFRQGNRIVDVGDGEACHRHVEVVVQWHTAIHGVAAVGTRGVEVGEVLVAALVVVVRLVNKA